MFVSFCLLFASWRNLLVSFVVGGGGGARLFCLLFLRGLLLNNSFFFSPRMETLWKDVTWRTSSHLFWLLLVIPLLSSHCNQMPFYCVLKLNEIVRFVLCTLYDMWRLQEWRGFVAGDVVRRRTKSRRTKDIFLKCMDDTLPLLTDDCLWNACFTVTNADYYTRGRRERDTVEW